MPYALCGDGIAATARDSRYHEGDNLKKYRLTPDLHPWICLWCIDVLKTIRGVGDGSMGREGTDCNPCANNHYFSGWKRGLAGTLLTGEISYYIRVFHRIMMASGIGSILI